MQANPIGWFEIYVQDMPRAKKFYETVLDTKLEKLAAAEPEMWAFKSEMTQYGAGGALVKMDGMSSGGNSILVYFGCHDCAVEAARVSEAGGTVQREKMSIGDYGFIALVVDTEGNLFGLHSLE